MGGRIPCHHRDGSRSQNHVLQQELSRQGEQGEACHPWSDHENGQCSGKQDQAEQTDVAQPHPCKQEDGGTDFECSKDIDKRVKSQERKGCRKQTSDRTGISEFQRSNPEKNEGKTVSQKEGCNSLDKLKHAFHHVLLRIYLKM